MSSAKFITACIGVGLSCSLALSQEPAGIPVPAPAAAEGLRVPKGAAVPRPVGAQVPYEGAYYETGDCNSPDVISPIWADWYSKLKGNHKAPYQKYNHNQGDLQPRPIMSPLCSPTWGYHETCWHEFPAVPVCPPRCPAYASRATTRSAETSAATIIRTKQTVYRANNSARD